MPIYGLTDKNGRKIFEGDICVIHDFCDDEKFIVEYDTDNGRYLLRGENTIQDFGKIYRFYDFEVISNIFEGGTKMKLYISGPITGTDDYMERFAAAQKELEEEGWTVINPALVNSNLPKDTEWKIT